MSSAPHSSNPENAQHRAKTTGESSPSSVARKPYTGATLRHLGSVRDVTLAKTKNAPEGLGTKHT